jgi:hypothetical protein
MFGDSTFQFNFDDDDEAEHDRVVPNNDLPAELARSHHAVEQAMHWHRPPIPLDIIPGGEEPTPPGVFPSSFCPH